MTSTSSAPVRFYLASGGADAATHRLTRGPPAGGENSWAAIPLGAPVLGGLDEVVNQTLAYELRADEEMHLAGPVTAHLRFSCNEIDSQVIARLGRIAGDGSYHYLSMDTIGAARRRPDPSRSTSCEIAIDTEHPEPLTPGEPVTLTFSLTPGRARLRPGERLRLDVASRTDLLRSPGHAYFDMPVPPYFSRNRLHYGPDCYVELHHVP